MWRDKVFAHRDIRKTLSGGIAKEYPIPEQELDALVERGFGIAQHYYGLYFQVHYGSQWSGLDDFERTLRPLQQTLEARSQ